MLQLDVGPGFLVNGRNAVARLGVRLPQNQAIEEIAETPLQHQELFGQRGLGELPKRLNQDEFIGATPQINTLDVRRRTRLRMPMRKQNRRSQGTIGGNLRQQVQVRSHQRILGQKVGKNTQFETAVRNSADPRRWPWSRPGVLCCITIAEPRATPYRAQPRNGLMGLRRATDP